MRNVILHCHIFKNAGTSVDAVFKKNFPGRWVEQEFDRHPDRYNATDVLEFIKSRPEVSVVSTHTGDWNLHISEPGLTVLPIVFLRPPLARVRSAYEFERKQDAETMGARVARSTDLAGYVQFHLGTPNNKSFRNFQSRRLAALVSKDKKATEATDDTLHAAALQALAKVPYFGLVNHFSWSLTRLERYLCGTFPSFRAENIHRNKTGSGPRSRDEVAADLVNALGDGYHQLLRMNSVDIQLYDHAEKLALS